MSKLAKVTRDEVVRSVSRGLIDFGYPDADETMISEILDSWLAGKRFPDLPHGVIGAFAEDQFKQLDAAGLKLSDLTA